MIELGDTTVFFGKNGAGKTSAQDAIKSAHIVNQTYLVLNTARQGNQGSVEKQPTTLDQYLTRFGEKLGPSIVGFHMEIISKNDNAITDTYTFGIGAEKAELDYFYIEGVDKDKLHEIIQGATSFLMFLDTLKTIGRTDTFKRPDSEKEYHQILHDKNIVFYNKITDKDYIRYLSTLKDLIEAVHTGQTITMQELKNLLFPKAENTRELQDTLNNIVNAAIEMKKFDNEKLVYERQRNALENFLKNYKKYYEDFYFPDEIVKLNALQNEINHKKELMLKDNEELGSKEKEIREISAKLKETDVGLVKGSTRRDDSKIIRNKLTDFFIFIASNKEVIFTTQASLALEKKTIEDKIAKNKAIIIKKKNSISGNLGVINLRKNAIAVLREAGAGKEEKRNELIQKSEKNDELLKQLRNKTFSLVQTNDTFNKLSAEIQNYEDWFYKRFSHILPTRTPSSTFDDDETILKKDLSNLEYERKKIQDELEEIKEMDVEHGSNLSRFSIPPLNRLIDHFSTISIDEAKQLEPLLGSYWDHYVISKEDLDALKKVLLDTEQRGFEDFPETNFLVVDNYEQISVLQKASIPGTELTFSFSDIFKVACVKRPVSPKRFAKEARMARQKEMITSLELIDQKIVEIGNALKFLQETLKYAKTRLTDEENELQGMLQGNTFEDVKTELDAKIQSLEALSKKFIEEISELDKEEDKRQSRINDLESDIKEKEETIKSTNEYIEDLSKSISEDENRLKDISEKITGYDSIFSSLNDKIKAINGNIDKIIPGNSEETLDLIPDNILDWKDKLDAERSHFIDQVNKRIEELDHQIGELKGIKGGLEKEIDIKKQLKDKLQQAIEDMRFQIAEFESKRELFEKNLQSSIKKTLFDDFLFIEEDPFEVYYSRMKMRKFPEGANFQEKKIALLQILHEGMENVGHVFNVPINAASAGGVDLKQVLTALPVPFENRNNMKFIDWFNKQLEEFMENIKRSWSNYYNHFKAFFRLIEQHVKRMNDLNNRYQRNVEGIKFGSIKEIQFRFNPNEYYSALQRLVTWFEDEKFKKQLSKEFEDVDVNADTIIQFFAKEIFGDAHTRQAKLLDPHEYFSFAVLNVTDKKAPRDIFLSSGGESAGAAFLIYVNALSTLRKICKHQGELFMYADESGKWDPETKSDILRIAANLGVRIIMSEVDALSLSIDKSVKLIQYHMFKGVPTPIARFDS